MIVRASRAWYNSVAMLDPESSGVEWIDTVAERRISEAIDAGQFDDLPGKGRPLEFDDDPLTAAHLRIAHHVLKNARVVPAWIAVEQEIADAKARAESHYSFWLGNTGATEAQLGQGRADFERMLRHANDLILRHNLVSAFVHRSPIPFRVKERLARWDREIASTQVPTTGGSS